MSSNANQLSQLDEQCKARTSEYSFSNRIELLKTNWPHDSNRYEHRDITDDIHLPAIISIYKEVEWNDTDHIMAIISKAYL